MTLLRFYAVLTLLLCGFTGCEMFPGVDFVKKGYSQEELRKVVSSALHPTLPNDTSVLQAFGEGGRDPTSWFLVSCPTAMNDFYRRLQKEGYVRSSFSRATPPRAIPPSLRQYIDLADFADETSLVFTHAEQPESSGVWIIFSRHKKAFLACSYSS
jgi:hypothetical protein